MSKIKAIIDPYIQSPEVTAIEIQNAAKGVVPDVRADIIRDVDGKIVQVVLNLPEDIADGTVGDAAAAVDSHGGVVNTEIIPTVPLLSKSITTITEGTGTNQIYSTLPDGCLASFISIKPDTFTVYSSALAVNRPTGVASNIGPQLVDNQWYYGKINMTGDGVIPDPAPAIYPLVYYVINYSNSVYGVNLVDVNVAAVNFKLDYATDVNNSNVIDVAVPSFILKTTDIIGPQEPMAMFYIDKNGTIVRVASIEELLQKISVQG